MKHKNDIMLSLGVFAGVGLAGIASFSACSATGEPTGFEGTGGAAAQGASNNVASGTFASTATGAGGGFTSVSSGSGTSTGSGGDPMTCQEAAQSKTYIGCDFWPTVTPNAVWSIFDFAVVVANAGDQPADVTVDQGGTPIGTTVTIPPNELRTIFLPWVPELKGPDCDNCGGVQAVLNSTVRVPNGAYHLVSSRPVTVYQFSALEYGPQGGPPGKDWSSCPGNTCTQQGVMCFSYSNDASLLLPSTALTSNYRVTGYPGWMAANLPGVITVTGIDDATTVTVTVSSNGAVTAGPGVTAANAGGQTTFTINRGEVVTLAGTPTTDLSGSLVQSDKPVQVISAMACVYIPSGVSACDHIEESVFPAETLGKHYFVTVPTSPSGQPVAHLVRIYGNVDGTQLSYPAGKPMGMPDTINAGQVVEVGYANLIVDPFATPPFHWERSVTENFEIVGDHEFAVGSFQFGAQALTDLSTPAAQGDPAMSLATAVEQYRKKYVFLAPTDYDVNFVDVISPVGVPISIDGVVATGSVTPIGGSGYVVLRFPLGPGQGGAHVLTAPEPVGIQVMGYGSYTSYQYPGGLNLDVIAPPPPPPN